jgi:hypothetical protein
MTSVPIQGEAEVPSKFWLLLTASLVSSLIMLDSNIVAVSLPAIGRSLGASFTDLQWVISAYVLTYASLLLASGGYADLRGRKKSMLIGLTIFAVASAACGLATNSLILNLARATQGVGGAFLVTASIAILTNAFTSDERNQAFAFWGASLGIALAVGPIIGGAITNFVGWRWAFLVSVPASAILVLATLKFIGESRDPNAKRLDIAGTVTFSVGLALLLWALIDGNDAGWSSRSIILRLAAAFVFLAAFVTVELRRTVSPADVPRRCFGDDWIRRQRAGDDLLPALVSRECLRLRTAIGRNCDDPLRPADGACTTDHAPAGDPFLRRVFACRGTSYHRCGQCSVLAGWPISPSLWGVPRRHGDRSCGAGLLNGQTVRVLQGAVPEDRAGMASGLASTTRFIGILVSVAALGAILSDVARERFVAGAARTGLAMDAVREEAAHVTSGDLAGLLAAAPAGAREALRSAALTAYGAGFASAAIVAAGIAFIAYLLAYGLISSQETAPVPQHAKMPCKVIDCRDPL